MNEEGDTPSGMEEKMKKIYVNVEELESLVVDIKAISDSDAKMVLLLGSHPGGETSMVNTAIVCGKQEQISSMFYSTGPEERDVNKLYGKLILKASEFVNLASSLLTFKEKVYLEFEQGVVYLGVDDSVRLPLHLLAEEVMPQIVKMNQDELIIQVKVGVKPFLAAVRTGAYMSLADENNLQKLGNTAFVVSSNQETESVTSELNVYSSNGFALSKGSTNIEVQPGKEIPEAMKSPNGNFMVAIPKRSINALQKLLSGNENCIIAVSQKHIFVGIGKRTLFTFSQGSGVNPVVFKADEWVNLQKGNCIVLDAESLKGKVDLLNKVSDFSGEVKPLQFIFEPDKDVIIRISGADDEGEVLLKPVGQRLSEKVEAMFSGKQIVDVLNTLKRGNVRISFMDGKNAKSFPVEFSNGNLDAMEKHSGIAFVTQVVQKKPDGKKVDENTKAEENVEESKIPESTKEEAVSTAAPAKEDGEES